MAINVVMAMAMIGVVIVAMISIDWGRAPCLVPSPYPVASRQGILLPRHLAMVTFKHGIMNSSGAPVEYCRMKDVDWRGMTACLWLSKLLLSAE